MTSSNGNIFRVTGPLYGEFTGHRWIPSQRLMTQSFAVFFDLCLNKRLSKQSWGWWFETPLRLLWRHCNVIIWCCIQHCSDRGVTTHLLSIECSDWPKLHEIFEALDAKTWQRKFPAGFPVRVYALDLLFIKIFHDFVAHIESRLGG